MAGHASPLFAFDLASTIAALEELVAATGDDVLPAEEAAIIEAVISRLRALLHEGAE